MRINHNIAALNTHRQLTAGNAAQSKSMEKLSSGLKINRAGDDAAGLAISEKMRGQIRGLDMAAKNAQDGISLIQTAEGALNETHDILQRMRELAVQGANDTNTLTDRKEIQKELNQLIEEVDRIANNTEFNTKKLLNGDLAGTKSNSDNTTEAAVTGSAIADVTALNFSTTNTVFKINDKEITLDKDYTGKTMDDLVSDFQAALDTAGITDVTVGKDATDPTKLTLTSENDIKIEAATTGDIADIGLAAGTTAAEETENEAGLSSTSGGAVIHIGANSKQSLTVDINKMDSTTLGGGSSKTESTTEAAVTGSAIADVTALNFSTTNTVFKINDKEITLDKDYTGKTMDDLVSDFQAALDTAGITDVTVGKDATDPTKLTLTSENDIKIEAATTGDIADIGLAAGTTAAEATENEAGSNGTTIGSLKVTDVDNATEASGGVLSQAGADAAIENIQKAIEQVSAERSKLGAFQNRLDHTINNLGTSSENLTAAESRIRDVDYALAA